LQRKVLIVFLKCAVAKYETAACLVYKNTHFSSQRLPETGWLRFSSKEALFARL